jgi:hypothetical protein
VTALEVSGFSRKGQRSDGYIAGEAEVGWRRKIWAENKDEAELELSAIE